MSILVTGSIAYDDLKSPFGEAKGVLGGSAVYFSIAASKFTKVYPVSIVGEDFRVEDIELLKSHGICSDYIIKGKGKTFRWEGEYGYDLNVARTIKTELNVFEDFNPRIPDEIKNPDILFLANIDPSLQMKVMEEAGKPKIKACDTMDFWISSKRKILEEVIGNCDIVFLNEGEARFLTGETNLVKAFKKINKLGNVKYLIIKRGEYGSLCFSKDKCFFVPGFPLENVKDPTGAGDSFAGGVLGFIDGFSSQMEEKLNFELIKQALVIGTVIASFTVEEFGTINLQNLTLPKIIERFNLLKEMTHFSSLEILREN